MQSTADITRSMWSWMDKPVRHVEGAGRDYGAVLRDLAQPWGELYDAWVDAVRPKPWTGDKHASGCSCPRCRDDCRCRCCISDADLLVRARVGERRIVPIVIENNWRREREIELELSNWSAPSTDVKVTGELMQPTKFILKPCEEKTVILGVSIGAGRSDNERELNDVRDCVVFYADLRIIGCDMRSVRIAVAVLPRDCDAFRIDCRCVCC